MRSAIQTGLYVNQSNPSAASRGAYDQRASSSTRRAVDLAGGEPLADLVRARTAEPRTHRTGGLGRRGQQLGDRGLGDSHLPSDLRLRHTLRGGFGHRPQEVQMRHTLRYTCDPGRSTPW